jgi:hypothetical protein
MYNVTTSCHVHPGPLDSGAIVLPGVWRPLIQRNQGNSKHYRCHSLSRKLSRAVVLEAHGGDVNL